MSNMYLNVDDSNIHEETFAQRVILDESQKCIKRITD